MVEYVFVVQASFTRRMRRDDTLTEAQVVLADIAAATDYVRFGFMAEHADVVLLAEVLGVDDDVAHAKARPRRCVPHAGNRPDR